MFVKVFLCNFFDLSLDFFVFFVEFFCIVMIMGCLNSCFCVECVIGKVNRKVGGVGVGRDVLVLLVFFNGLVCKFG